ncbi:MAG: prepilin-type N-terminal cleavage/methylation domain-containing protein [Desulfamplus sp.]|nr:prepilin-type N-terminal cleavage/methylation domain-containing protein [Desulfamplus sp.]
MNKKSKNSAFTLTEMMVAIAIISILVSVAIPNIIDWLPDYRLKSMARGIRADMQLAKLSAIKNNQSCKVLFEATGYRIWSDPGPDGQWGDTVLSERNDNVVLRSVVFEHGIKYGKGVSTKNVPGVAWAATPVLVSYNNQILTFNSRGTCNSGYVYLDNSKNTQTYSVGTFTTGMILVQKWDGTQWD